MVVDFAVALTEPGRHCIIGKKEVGGVKDAVAFTVLGSGSGGNASLLNADGFAVLLDVGLGPRQLATRLASTGATWNQIRAVLLTHTHTDHWNESTLNHLFKLKIPLYCHPNITLFWNLLPGFSEPAIRRVGARLRCR